MRLRRLPVMTLAATAGLAGVLIAHWTGSTTLHLAQAPLAGPPGHTPSSVPTGPPASSSSQRSAVGAMEQYGYGQVQVKVTVVGNRIVQATVVSLQTPDSYSQSIANQAIPMLQHEILSAGSLNVSAIAGATYTSDGYGASIQSALDKLKVK